MRAKKQERNGDALALAIPWGSEEQGGRYLGVPGPPGGPDQAQGAGNAGHSQHCCVLRGPVSLVDRDYVSHLHDSLLDHLHTQDQRLQPCV
jgi:hypothetical protein